MALDTSPSLRKLVIYEIFVRNHSPGGRFAGVTADLPRIKGLGVDVVWLMPIHPVGQVKRKGTEGSPYAIADYRAINPRYGPEADFKELIETAHSLGLKVMLDLVYNHTSPDSVLARQQPDWFYQDRTGQPCPRVPDWWDVVDLVYDDPALFDYQIETMLRWVRLGVDGFRCDVAPLVPLAFWQQARAAVARLNPDFIWLAESVDPFFIRSMRRQGYLVHADAELYQAFDLTYDYDVKDEWLACLSREISPADYAEALARQEVIYPANYIKLRFLENHDWPRFAVQVPELNQLKCWTAFIAFLPGALLLYAGQEAAATHRPSLFDPDPIRWPEGEPVLTGFLSRLTELKKEPATNGLFDLFPGETNLQARWDHQGQGLYGFFNVRGRSEVTPVELSDGRYLNLLDDTEITVSKGQLDLPLSPVIVRY